MKKTTFLLIIILIAAASTAGAKQKGRKFYLTQDLFSGSEALTACADGYHMASLWEIFDPTNLRYNTTLGFTPGDSGFGPPADVPGWIRTGWFQVSPPSGAAGQANCLVWTSDSNLDHGTIVELKSGWAGNFETISPWSAAAIVCDFPLPVWCVQD